jgi:hypothetical protein
MLAVAVFAFAAVGFAVALNEVIGINVELLRTGMRRQAMDSCAAKILATTNNLQPTKGFRDVEDDGVIFLKAAVNPIEPWIELPGTNNSATARRIGGWWMVEIQAETKKEVPLERISFLIWPQR